MIFRKDAEVVGTRSLIPATPVNGSVAVPIPNNMSKKSPLEGFKGDGVVLVGKGTRMTGEIKDSSVIEIQGDFEGDVVANAVIVREGATFKGTMHSEYVEAHGLIEGSVVAEQLLDIRSTGHIAAEVRYGQLCVATGGRLSGSIRTQETIEGERLAPQPADLSKVNGHANGHAHTLGH